jgi:membrane protease YdiL (CAAX protease family)
MNARPAATGASGRRAAWILAGIAAVEGTWVVWNWTVNPTGLLRYTGFGRGGNAGAAPGWLLAFLVAVSFIVLSSRLPSVRMNLFRPSWLKLLALAVAVSAGILEEAVFRRVAMDAIEHRGGGSVVQVLASGLLFGLAHGIWGLAARSVRAAIGATIATGSLGIALAIVYLAGGRSLAPCIAAHFLINLLAEPGLVLSALRGETARSRTGKTLPLA